jgi:hypothetical protein
MKGKLDHAVPLTPRIRALFGERPTSADARNYARVVPPACRLEGAGHAARAIENSEGVKRRIFAAVEHLVRFGYHHCRVDGGSRGMKRKPFWKGVKPGDLVRCHQRRQFDQKPPIWNYRSCELKFSALKPACPRPRPTDAAAVLGAVKARPGNAGGCLTGRVPAGLDSPLCAAAYDICGRDGRKPAGAVEQKKGTKSRERESSSRSGGDDGE